MQMRKGFFITGSGTNVGKTVATSILLGLADKFGINAAVMKPVQTGSLKDQDGRLLSPDLQQVLKLNARSFSAEDMQLMSSYNFGPACSPHLAAKMADSEISIPKIESDFRKLSEKFDFMFVEGAGGAYVPLSDSEDMTDLIKALKLDAIIVTDLKLGTLNHTLLTIDGLKSKGITIAGIILNKTEDCEQDRFIYEDNYNYIKEKCGVPVLFKIDRFEDLNPEVVSDFCGTLSRDDSLKNLFNFDTQTETDALKQKDIAHLWHPFTDIEQFKNAKDYHLITAANGSFLTDINGKKYLDGISSWWCVNLGHSNPQVLSALQQAAPRLQQSILGSISHKDAVLLSEELAEVLPGDLNHIFYASDGSSAVEAALKIALQYWWNNDAPEKNRFVHLDGSYHGDTLGAVSVGYIDSFHASLKHIIRKNYTAETPHAIDYCPHGYNNTECSQRCFHSIENILREKQSEIAAVIVEPLCLAAGGMRIYSAEYLKKLSQLCKELNILLIADEIAVGFGRTGKMFASNHAQITPDIMVLGKGLTAGFIAMSAVAATHQIYNSFRNTSSSETKNKTFFHGHTFSGSPLAAACARAALKVYTQSEVLKDSLLKGEQLKQSFRQIAEKIPGAQTNQLGMIAMLKLPEILNSGQSGKKLATESAIKARTNGLMIRPLGDVLYLFPPLTSSRQELDQMLSILSESIDACMSQT